MGYTDSAVVRPGLPILGCLPLEHHFSWICRLGLVPGVESREPELSHSQHILRIGVAIRLGPLFHF